MPTLCCPAARRRAAVASIVCACVYFSYIALTYSTITKPKMNDDGKAHVPLQVYYICSVYYIQKMDLRQWRKITLAARLVLLHKMNMLNFQTLLKKTYICLKGVVLPLYKTSAICSGSSYVHWIRAAMPFHLSRCTAL